MVKIDDKYFIKEDGYSFILCKNQTSEDVSDQVKKALEKRGRKVSETKEVVVGYYTDFSQAIKAYIRQIGMQKIEKDKEKDIRSYLNEMNELINELKERLFEK